MGTTENKISKMQSDIQHMARSFDEFKSDAKEFHKVHREQWAKLSLIMDNFTDIKVQIKKVIIDEQEDSRNRFKELFWRFVPVILLLILAIYTIKLTHETKTLHASLESGDFIVELVDSVNE